MVFVGDRDPCRRDRPQPTGPNDRQTRRQQRLELILLGDLDPRTGRGKRAKSIELGVVDAGGSLEENGVALARELFTHIGVAGRGSGDDHEVRFELVDLLGVGDADEPVFGRNSIDLRVSPHEDAGYLETVRPGRRNSEEGFRSPTRPDDNEP